MRKISSILCALLLLFSCSKKSDPVATTLKECLLTKMVYTQPASSYTLTDTYEYNSDRRLVTVNEVTSGTGFPTTTSVFTHSYVNGMVAAVAAESTTAGSPKLTAAYTWTNVGTHVTKIDGQTTQTITYDANGNLKTSESTFAGSVTSTAYTFSTDLQFVSSVTGASNNQVKVDNSYGTFDGHKSHYTLLAKAINQPFYVHHGFLLSPQNLFKANPLSERLVLTLPGSAPQTTDYTYDYEYNSQGYPTKITQKISGQTYTVTTLEYKDCN